MYAIADLTTLGEGLPAAVTAMVDAGIRWLQLRAKGASGGAVYRLTEEVSRRLEGSGCRFWLDDRADIAALLPVDGVHLGQRDLPPSSARPLLAERWIGLSTHTRSQVRTAARDPEVDVVAVGPIFATASKADPDPAVGLDLLRQARAETTKPLVAIGGIDASNADRVLAAGADTVAVIGALGRREVYRSCRRLLAAVGEDGRDSAGSSPANTM